MSVTTSTPSRVYFYIPANKSKRNYIRFLAGILLYTRKQRGNEQHPLPRGYTFIYPQTKRERTTSTPSRVYFYIPANKEDYTTPQNFLHNLAGILLCSMFYPTTSRVYFYIPTDKEGYSTPRNFLHNLTGILLYTRKQRGSN